MRSPELKIEAITPVAGNMPLKLTLSNALRLVEIAGRSDIPVAAGATGPLVRRLVTATEAHGENGLGGVPFPEPKAKPVPETAVQLICRMVRDSPGEISIITLGPLTNLAQAFREDPRLPSMIRDITMMGGSLSGGNMTPAAEFNFYVDPEAADVVFRSGAPLTMVGLDVTRRTVLPEQHIQTLESASDVVGRAAGHITRAMMKRFRARGKCGPVMHDALAVAAFVDLSVVTFQKFHVEVETAGEFTAGETLGYQRQPVRRSAVMQATKDATRENAFRPNAKVAMDVDLDRFFQLLVGRLTGQKV
jgi:inosine-uridine nucleoside N-ribohydrolase